MSETAYVNSLPLCQMPSHMGTHVEAEYDARIPSKGQWGYVCGPHFTSEGCSLGTGKGQRLILGEPPERTDADIRAEVAAAIESGDLDALEDAIGDRDFAEFI